MQENIGIRVTLEFNKSQFVEYVIYLNFKRYILNNFRQVFK